MTKLPLFIIIFILALISLQYYRFLDNGCSGEYKDTERSLSLFDAQDRALSTMTAVSRCSFFDTGNTFLRETIARWERCGYSRNSARQVYVNALEQCAV